MPFPSYEVVDITDLVLQRGHMNTFVLCLRQKQLDLTQPPAEQLPIPCL